MKYIISGGLLILAAILGGAFGMTYFTSEAYIFASFLTALGVGGVGVTLASLAGED